jgi:ChpA-C
VSLPVSLPVDICGNAVALLGRAQADCGGGAAVGGAQGGGLTGGGAPSGSTGGSGSVGGGNQVDIPVEAPVNACGIAVAVLGTATASCQGGSASAGSDSQPRPEHAPPPGSASTPGSKPAVVPSTGSTGSTARTGSTGSTGSTGRKGSRPSPDSRPSPSSTPSPSGSGGHGYHHGTNPLYKAAGGHRAGGHRAGDHGAGLTTSTAVRTVANTGGISSGLLPTTGADLEGLLALAVGGVISGAALLAASRRRVAARGMR